MGKLRMVSTFTGIGCQERGVQNAGYDLDVVATCELDKDAIISYAAIHNGLTMEMIDNIAEVNTSNKIGFMIQNT